MLSIASPPVRANFGFLLIFVFSSCLVELDQKNEAGGQPYEPWPVWPFGFQADFEPTQNAHPSAWECCLQLGHAMEEVVKPSQPTPLPTTGFSCTCAADAGSAL